MRLAIPIMEAVGAAWYPIVMKRKYEEPDFVKLREKFQAVEDYLAKQ